ncbi:DUF3667 domain-containing protein [Chitinimonas sp.]|uniref:DUF3667 domain-containing protein n=1 Tax=Chitinimonas sp. TaxID=1934313 RepID=UPI0035B445D4
MTESAATPASHCPNCQHEFGTITPKFCPACGQESHIKPPTLGELAQQFGGAYLSTEGALWRTLKLLLFRPGELTRQYLAGRRKHYVLPLRLYLTVSVVVILIWRSTVQVDTASILEHAQDPAKLPSYSLIEVDDLRVGVSKGQFVCTGLSASWCARLQDRLPRSNEAVRQRFIRLQERLSHGWSQVLFLLMPGFAVCLALLYRSRRLRYTEHLVFSLHLHSYWFVALGLMRISLQPLQLAALTSMPIYALLAMYRVYGGRWWGLLPRALLLFVFYLVLILLCVIGFALLAFLL